MRYLDVRLRQPDSLLHPMQAFIRHEDAVRYEEMRSWSVRMAEDRQYALYYVEGDIDRYRSAVEGVESIVDCRIATVEDGAAHVWVCERIRPENRALFDAFLERDLIVVPPVRFDSEAAMGLTIVGDGGDIQRMLEDIPEAVEVTVNEIGSYDRRDGALLGALTDRQERALRAALDVGYYEVPREADLSEVADTLGCAESTASTLLRRGERAVLSRTLER